MDMPLVARQQADTADPGTVSNQPISDEASPVAAPDINDVVNVLLPPPPNLGNANNNDNNNNDNNNNAVPPGQGALPMTPLDDDEEEEQIQVFTGVEPGDQPLDNTNNNNNGQEEEDSKDITIFTGVEPGESNNNNNNSPSISNPPAAAPSSNNKNPPVVYSPPSASVANTPTPPPHIRTGPPVINPQQQQGAPTDDAGHQIPGNAEPGYHDDPNWKPHDFPGHESTVPHNKQQSTNQSLFLSPRCASRSTWYSQFGCHVRVQVQSHPLSIAVICLALYALVLIRRRRQRHAVDSARGEYRQVTARFADTAFGDDYSPAENADYLSDDDDENDNWIDDEQNGGSIQMRTFGKDGLTLDEMNG